MGAPCNSLPSTDQDFTEIIELNLRHAVMGGGGLLVGCGLTLVGVVCSLGAPEHGGNSRGLEC